MDTKKFLIIVSVTVIFITLFCDKIIEGVVDEEVEEVISTYEPIDDTAVYVEDFGIDCVNNCEVFCGKLGLKLDPNLLFVVKDLFVNCFVNPPLLGDLEDCLSIITVFFPCDFEEPRSLKDFLGLPEIVSFVFFFSISHLSIFINYVSCSHN